VAKEDLLKVEGEVVEILPNATFRVKLDNIEDKIVLGHISGKMRRFNIKVIQGDRVELEMSPYDLTKGRISRRL